MLSIANISSSAAAAKYHEEDDYYSEGSIEHQNLSQWFGNGAKALGLSGKVSPEDFRKILDGELPSGEQIGKKNDKGEVTHAPGIDMTFSAPKSVSVMAEVAGDNRIFELHQNAVKKALLYAEDNFISTRVKVEDKVIRQQTKNIVAAIFRHDTSRNLDPQLHTHCVVANIVERQDGQWKSAFHGEIFDNKMLLGVVYRAELAKGLGEIGYNIERTHTDGRFEITGLPKELLESYSTRSQEIREALKNYDFKNAKTAADATLKTREVKKSIDRDTVGKIWEEVLKKSGHDKDSLFKLTSEAKHDKNRALADIIEEKIQPSFLKEKIDKFLKIIGLARDIDHIKIDTESNKLSPKNIAKLSLDAAIEHLSERESVFEKKNILSTALSYGIGKISFDALLKAFDEHEKKGILLPSKDSKLQNFYTTKAAIELESDTIKIMKNGRNKIKPITSLENAKTVLTSSSLNPNQKQAAQFLLTTKDQIVGIQGYAGVGKTYTLKIVKEIAQKEGCKLTGMAPSASAAKTLQDDSGIQSQTLASFLFKYKGLIEGRGTKEWIKREQVKMKNHIFVLDEGSLAPTKHMNALFKVATKLGARVIVVGDTKQLDAVEAGKPFYQLQKAGMKTAIMDNIIRQNNVELKSSIEAIAIKGDIKKAFHRFEHSKTNKIIEESIKQIPQRVVKEFLDLKREERDKTLILAPANETREEINKLLREELKKEGQITGAEITFERMAQKDLSSPQRSDARNYSVGDIVLFNKNYKSLNIDSGEYLVVEAVDQQKGTVWLKKPNGKLIGWNPSKVGAKRVGVVEVFEKKPITLQEGDKIFWKRNSKSVPEIINSRSAIVKKINEEQVLFNIGDGKELTLKTSQGEIKHLDYGYSSTVYSSQGQTVDNVIAVAESYRKYLTSQKSFYVTISRARDKVMLIMDDKQKVAERLQEYTGEKISALESQKIAEHSINHIHENKLHDLH